MFCGACGCELAPEDMKSLPNANSSFAWQQESPGCSFWRCQKCVDLGRFPPGFESDSWYRALADDALEVSASSRLRR